MDFDRVLADEHLANTQATFATRDVKARGRPGKWAAPSFATCPDDLARWLVEQCADVAVADAYGTRRPQSSCMRTVRCTRASSANPSSSKPIHNFSPVGNRMPAALRSTDSPKIPVIPTPPISPDIPTLGDAIAQQSAYDCPQGIGA
ncbi:hypothetical protein [Burkholderia lata]|uniref:hypothetical protein n=1 Tax=Burkholderia lata (strain ATCC 17760 / DSM 23089 / LMG 22485 / NCIMB 9086 / R18194 / 383) TaxID=482957 RepID=UPI001581AC74|nr:hypothetical protein [Burkholderia lata]